MKKFFDDPDILTQFNKMKKQLNVLEEKIDSLIHKSGQKHSRRNNFSDRNYDSKEIKLTQVTCSACHKECKIPFKPTENRPVYCNDCFSKQKKDNEFGENRFDKPKKKSDFPKHFKKRKNHKRGQF